MLSVVLFTLQLNTCARNHNLTEKGQTMAVFLNLKKALSQFFAREKQQTSASCKSSTLAMMGGRSMCLQDHL